MKMQIRRGVFETNSSSMHSLAIFNGLKEENKYYTVDEVRSEIEQYVDDKGVFNSEYHEVFYDKGQDDWYFGRWPMYVLTTFVEKLAYAYASTGDAYTLGEILKEYCPKIEKIHWPNEYGLDADTYGIIRPRCDFDSKKSYTQWMKDFLLDKTRWVISDGDEYCIFDKLLATGIFKDNLITRSDGSSWFDDHEDLKDRDW